MKNKLLLAVFLFFSFGDVSAQYCGNSGPTICTPSGSLPPGTFTPSEDIPCIVRGQNTNTVIHFRNYDTARYQGTLVTIATLMFDSLGNLPAGLCWATDDPNNTLTNLEFGCLRISGVTYAAPGQYRLFVRVRVDIGLGIPVPVNAEELGMELFVRVVPSPSSFCPPVDTAQTDSVVTYGNLGGNYAVVRGKLYFDVNQNQIWDNGEQAVPNQFVHIGNADMAISNGSGNYVTYPDPGTYSIKPVLSGNIASFPVNPDSIVLQADSGVVYSGNDFGIVAPASYCEGSLAIVAGNPPPRPGFNNRVQVRFTNSYSAQAVNQTVQLSYSLPQRYVSASPAPDVVDTLNRTLSWNISNVQVGTTWMSEVTFYSPTTTTLGASLKFNAAVNNSNCTSLDSLWIAEDIVVVGSYDPNDKAVSPAGESPGGRVLPSTSFHYTIRFQNTGTYMAEIVRITDTISPYLNLSTLKVLAASHDYEVQISGREVTFLFDQIFLADSHSNEPMSHGFIQYSIRPTSNFVQGTVIENLADIYFDFNTPIRTNTTVSTADNFLGIAKTGTAEVMLVVYPNPLLEGRWKVAADERAMGKQVYIYDAQGRVVFADVMEGKEKEIDATELSQGIYILRIGNQSIRLVKL